ncbi:hypothetical protein IAD21_03981 [Abditibacteriota bacterium]|nr:hypothetical protein IAD21_03981 [Abditibacteriota bacterium]
MRSQLRTVALTILCVFGVHEVSHAQKTLPSTSYLKPVCTIHTGTNVNCIAFTPDSSRIISGNWDSLWDDYLDEKYNSEGRFSSWVIKTGKLQTRRKLKVPLLSVAYSPDGKWLATGYAGGLLRISDADTGRTVHQLHLETDGVKTDGIESIVFSPDGLTIACSTFFSGDHSNAGPLYLVNTQTGRLRGENYRGFFSGISSQSVWARNWFTTSVQSQQLVTHDNGISFSKPPQNKPTLHFNIEASNALATQGRWLAFINSQHSLCLWDLISRKQVARIENIMDAEAYLAYPHLQFSADGRYLALGTDGIIQVWRVLA